jgi:hypothetical protein
MSNDYPPSKEFTEKTSVTPAPSGIIDAHMGKGQGGKNDPPEICFRTN